MTSVEKNNLDSASFVNETNEIVKNVVDLLAAGEIKLKNEYGVENAIMIIGNTGAGKTTFALRLAGYDKMLQSQKKYGSYYITKPGSDVISDQYTSSSTIFPKLYLDKLANVAYYDFPGFQDTRGAAYDIATTYFIKKVVDSVKRLKMIFLINYSSFSPNGERDSFTKLIRHATQFVKNVEKFENSVALIATKVPVLPDSDECLIAGIADFMQEVQKTLKKFKDNKDYSRDVQLIEVLLSGRESKYPKIGLFKAPNQDGSLENVPLLLENKKYLEGMIAKLSFSEKIESDFGYFIPKQSLNEVSHIINAINQNIVTILQKSGKEIQDYLSSKESELYDLSKLNNKMKLEYDQLLIMREKANNQTETKDCIQTLVAGVESTYSNPLIQKSLIPAMQYGGFSSFLHTLSDHSTIDMSKCTTGLDNLIKYSFNTKYWYQYLFDLFARLSEYEIQTNTSSSNPCIFFANILAQWIEYENFSFSALFPFLQRCYPKYDYSLHDLSNMILNRPKLIALQRTLDSTLKNTFDIILCKSETLLMKRRYVTITDVVKAIADKCGNMRPKFIKIFALYKIFIDTNLNLTGYQADLTIIAPIWEIRGAPKIILDGESGEAHNPPSAPDGMNRGDDGKHGLPGLPGKAGGNFFGIGDMFIHPEQFTVSVNGGQGGPGQNGGNGEDGIYGSDATNDLFIESKNLAEKVVNSFGINSFGKIHSKQQRIKNVEVISIPGRFDVLIAGGNGTAGGCGGNGGIGGHGGFPGNIILIPLSFPVGKMISKVAIRGNPGVAGVGGKGGQGGKDGNDLFVKYPVFLNLILSIETKTQHVTTTASKGKNGITGKNDANRQFPEEKRSFSNLCNDVNNYKSYIKETLNHDSMESYLLEFLAKLEDIKNPVLEDCKENTISFVLKNDHEPQEILQQLYNHTYYPINLNVSRGRRHLMHHSTSTLNISAQQGSSDEQYQSSSANFIKSPINNAINLLSGFFTPLKVFYKPNAMNFNFIEKSIQSTFRTLNQFNIHSTGGYDHHFTSSAKLYANESLTLVDFLIRWITKMKPENKFEKKEINSLEIRASVLDIVDKFERMLKVLSVQYNFNVESLIDPVVLISELEKELINSNYENIGQILFQFVANNSDFLEDVHLYNYVSNEIDVLLLGLGN